MSLTHFEGMSKAPKKSWESHENSMKTSAQLRDSGLSCETLFLGEAQKEVRWTA